MVLALIVLGMVLLSWDNLNKLQEIISSSEVVNNLLDTSLEIRRFEKNYFLYKTEDDYRELSNYIERMRNLLLLSELKLFSSEESIAAIRHNIDRYNALLGKLRKSGFSLDIENSIREHGKQILVITERINSNRLIIKAKHLRSVKQHLIMGSSLGLLVWLVLGIFFYRKTVRTFMLLENHMNRVSKGEVTLIETKFKDRELLSLKAAFNKMLAELNSRHELLVKSEKIASMGTMIFGVAHELNNPLSNILSSCQILKEEHESDRDGLDNEMLAQIEDQAERAIKVVDSILDFSRSSDKQTFQLKSTLEETISFLKADVPAKISIRTNIPEDISLFGDKQKIQQVFINLIKNSIDAIGQEGSVHINALYSGTDRELVEIIVLDDGIGMPEDVLSNIFSPFYSSKQKRTGFGLGLFIVHSIIEEHKGSISVNSQADGGTAFMIILPVKEVTNA